MSALQKVHLGATADGVHGFFTGCTMAWSLSDGQYEQFVCDPELATQHARLLGFELEAPPAPLLTEGPKGNYAYHGAMALFARPGAARPADPRYFPVVDKGVTIWVRAVWLEGVSYMKAFDQGAMWGAAREPGENFLNSVPLVLG